MIGARLWRRRSQRVTAAPAVFYDSSDFIDDDLSDRGRDPTSLTSVAPRPSYVHRFYRSDLPSWSELVGGLGADQAPIQQAGRRPLTWLARKHVVVVGPRLRFPLVRSPTSQKRIEESWREFNKLRADPRTAMCLRRRSRREVLFARKVAGSRGMRTYRRTQSSQWSC